MYPNEFHHAQHSWLQRRVVSAQFRAIIRPVYRNPWKKLSVHFSFFHEFWYTGPSMARNFLSRVLVHRSVDGPKNVPKLSFTISGTQICRWSEKRAETFFHDFWYTDLSTARKMGRNFLPRFLVHRSADGPKLVTFLINCVLHHWNPFHIFN